MYGEPMAEYCARHWSGFVSEGVEGPYRHKLSNTIPSWHSQVTAGAVHPARGLFQVRPSADQTRNAFGL